MSPCGSQIAGFVSTTLNSDVTTCRESLWDMWVRLLGFTYSSCVCHDDDGHRGRHLRLRRMAWRGKLFVNVKSASNPIIIVLSSIWGSHGAILLLQLFWAKSGDATNRTGNYLQIWTWLRGCVLCRVLRFKDTSLYGTKYVENHEL